MPRLFHNQRWSSLLLFAVISLCAIFWLIETETNSHPLTGTKTFHSPKEKILRNHSSKSKRRLPDFSNGGVIVFFHLAKTGGTGIRVNLGSLPKSAHVDVHLLSTMDDYDKWAAQAEAILNRTYEDKKKILFLEFHGMLPSLPSLHETFQKWRHSATQHNTGYFSFSLVRDPISYAISYFNFYKTYPCSFPEDGGQWGVDVCKNLMAPTEENLNRTLMYNHQCQIYARDHWDLFLNPKVPPTDVTETECRHVYELLLQDMDWVGPTKTLSTETLPILTEMLVHNQSVGRNFPRVNEVSKSKPTTVRKEDLHASTLENIRRHNLYDIFIYEQAQRDFRIDDRWENFELEREP